MKRSISILGMLIFSLLAFEASSQTTVRERPAQLPFHSWAPTPPMGWNSWDCYGPTVVEDEVKANADYMAEKLRKFGWKYIVVDIRWYVSNDKSGGYNEKDPVFNIDKYGRFIPALNRFPSSANGQGFKPLADYIHSKGLKFGIHVMRGIPVLAVKNNLPVHGTNVTAADICDTAGQCVWLKDMYTVDHTKKGAQEYYNSIMDLYTSWGVDFLKIDDLSSPYHTEEIEMIRKAIDRTGRKIILSTSPGPTPVEKVGHIRQNANMWRTVGDFWDNWKQLKEQFAVLEKWAPYVATGNWPDGDMLPLGHIGIRAERGEDRMSGFTEDEQYTLMSLFAIFRSPLMFGGDLAGNDEFTLSLITNKDVLNVNQHSINGKQLFNENDLIAWTADDPETGDRYLALFNASDQLGNTAISVRFEQMGFHGTHTVTDLWNGESIGKFTGIFTRAINRHGAGLYRIHDEPRRQMSQPVVLNPDDKPAFSAAPEGFDKVREGISRGKIDSVEYTSKTIGTTRRMLIYTPPGYSGDKTYPVLYLLHGIGGDMREWYKNGSPEVILDNLYADKKLIPMIVVLPNGRAMKDDRPVGNIFDPDKVKAFETFEQDLLNDIIPFVESKYPALANRESRALAGLSMGGGQSLNFGLGNLNTFAWVGGFSSAPNTKTPEVLVQNPSETAQKLKLIWISCGDQDGLISFSQRLHKYLKEKNVPHIWHVEPGVHDFKVWKSDLYYFSQLIFK